MTGVLLGSAVHGNTASGQNCLKLELQLKEHSAEVVIHVIIMDMTILGATRRQAGTTAVQVLVRNMTQTATFVQLGSSPARAAVQSIE